MQVVQFPRSETEIRQWVSYCKNNNQPLTYILTIILFFFLLFLSTRTAFENREKINIRKHRRAGLNESKVRFNLWSLILSMSQHTNHYLPPPPPHTHTHFNLHAQINGRKLKVFYATCYGGDENRKFEMERGKLVDALSPVNHKGLHQG